MSSSSCLSLLMTAVAMLLQTNVASAYETEVSLDDLMTPGEIAEEAGITQSSSREELENQLKALLEGGSLSRIILPREGLTAREWVSRQNEIDKSRAKVVLIVNKASKGTTAQKMIAYVDGVEFGTFDVSTGREKFEKAKSGRSYMTSTPVGYFRPTLLDARYYSNTWKAYMEFAVFFRGGVAVHATTPDHYKELGSRASGGCVRMHRDRASEIFKIVKEAGKRTVPLINRDGEVALTSSGKEVTQINHDVLIIVRNIED